MIGLNVITNRQLVNANMIHKDFEEVWNSPYNFIPKLDENGSTKLAASEWFKQDIEMIIKFKSGYIEDHPDETYDAVLIELVGNFQVIVNLNF